VAETYRGFDIDVYPGAAALQDACAQGFSWTAAYLPAPSHHDAGWPDYPTLNASGLNILPVWVGAQVTGPGSHAVGATQGATEGLACCEELTARGYPFGCGVAFDTENGPPITPAQHDHLTAWRDAVVKGGYRPMVYCSYENFHALEPLFGSPNIWEFELVPYVPPANDFDGLGVQYAQNVELTLAGKLYRVDRSVSAMSDPAGAPAMLGGIAQMAVPQASGLSSGSLAPAPLPLAASPTAAAKAVQAAPPISAALTAAAVAAAGAIHVTGYSVDLSGLVNALVPYFVAGVLLPSIVWLIGRGLQMMHISQQSTAGKFVVQAVENAVQAEAAPATTYIAGRAVVSLDNQAAANVLRYAAATVPQRIVQSGITPAQLSALVTNRLNQIQTSPAQGASS
jgi:hypothetical protein